MVRSPLIVQSVSNANFGPLIAYLVPGATALWGFSRFSAPLRSWFAFTATASTFSTGNVLTIGDARYLRRSGGTMTGALTITKGGGYYTGVLLNVRGTISGQALTIMGNGQSTGALILQNGGMTISKMTTNGLKTTLFSVDGMGLNQLDGGAFFGRVGLKQGQWNLASSGATTWIARDSSRSWNSIAMSADGRFQTATLSSGNIYTSNDFGVSWTSRDSSRSWIAVAMSSDGKIQAATVTSGNVYVSTDYGVTWTARGTSQPWGYIAMSSDGKIITATIEGCGKYTSTDYGVTWPPVPGAAHRTVLPVLL